MKKFCLMINLILLLAACSQDPEMSKPLDFGVEVASTTHKVNEEVVFNLSGTAENIAFYSGEFSNDYNYREGRVMDLTDVGTNMAFSTNFPVAGQANQLTVHLSVNFNGDYSSMESVARATWIDVTNRFSLPTTAHPTTFTLSGSVDISDLIVPGRPVYVAFRYATKSQATNGIAQTWNIQGFQLSTVQQFGGQAINIINQANAGFRIVENSPIEAPVRSSATTTRLALLGNLYDPNNPQTDVETEQWAVSVPIHTNSIRLPPDRSIPIRGLFDSNVETSTHTYTTPGVYMATFVASNIRKDKVNSVVKKIEIVIEP